MCESEAWCGARVVATAVVVVVDGGGGRFGFGEGQTEKRGISIEIDTAQYHEGRYSLSLAND